MKKRLLILMGVMVLALSGCGGADSSEVAKAEEAASTTVEQESSEETNEEALEKTEEADTANEEEAVAEADETEEPKVEIDRSHVFEFLSDINVGWNLGNSLDARGVGNTLDSETCWNNVKNSQELIDCIKDAGIKAIRIPVTWAEHVGPAPEYKIDEAWMQRVKEVVDYAVNDDLYIMLDTHHEENDWLIVKPENQDELVAELSAIWQQIATEFKDYDNKLIFEGMNEPRCVGSEKEWNGGTEAEQAVINAMNMAFVDTVRATGGNNSDRLLVICTYGNSPSYKGLKTLEIPEDNNIAVAIHMYTPYTFTYVPTDGSPSVEKWDGSKKAEIVNTVKMLDEYLIQKDVPVIITEFGAQNKGNQDEICKWIADYLGTMNRFGIKCFVWDNGFYPNDGKNGNEYFALLHRETLEWYEPEIVDLLVNQNFE